MASKKSALQCDIAIQSSRHLEHWQFDAIADGISTNVDFFGEGPASITLVVCHTKAEWEKESKCYYFPNARGVVLRDGTIVIKSEKLAKVSPKVWAQIFTHECNHSLLVHMRGLSRALWSPIWLVEGLACYVAQNDLLLPLTKLKPLLSRVPNSLGLPFRYQAGLFRNFKELQILYSLWFHFVTWLAAYRRGKLLLLVKDLSDVRTKRDFEERFTERFGCSSEELFQRFLAKSRIVRR